MNRNYPSKPVGGDYLYRHPKNHHSMVGIYDRNDISKSLTNNIIYIIIAFKL